MKFGQTSKWASLGVLAASMMLVSVSANAWNDNHHKGYEKRSYQAQQSWRRGDYLPVAYHSPRYVVNDWRSQRLSAPPRGYEWRRVNDRFVQVSTGDHRIAHVW